MDCYILISELYLIFVYFFDFDSSISYPLIETLDPLPFTKECVLKF